MKRLKPFLAATFALVAVAAGCTPPDGEPAPQLPVAPRIALPASLPAGAQLLLSHNGPDTEPGGDWYIVGRDSVELLTPASSPLVLLPFYGRTAPDGRAIVTGYERPDLQLGDAVALCSTAASDSCRPIGDYRMSRASFSPDGSKIALTHRVGGLYRTTIIDSDTFELINEITNGEPGSTLNVPWSPDSSAVALVLRDVPASNTSPRSLAVLPATPGAGPSIVVAASASTRVFDVYGWSQDGWISYLQTDPLAPADLRTSIRTIRADGSGPSALLRQHMILQGHVALPDGSMIGGVFEGNVPHLLRRGQEPEPLAQPERWVDATGDRTSQTEVYGYALGN